MSISLLVNKYGIAAGIIIFIGVISYIIFRLNVQPDANQPVANQPAGNQPVANQPAGNQPAGNQPVANQPPTNPPSTVLPNSLPLTFENTSDNEFFNFEGGVMTVVANPNKSGINMSNKVAKMVKSVGSEIWAGSYITLDKPFDFSTNKIFKVKVYSPKSGAKIRLKVEHLTIGGMNLEKDANTTKVNEWEELTFNFNTYTSGTYQKVILFFDFGVVGDGTTNSTCYFDDITLISNQPAANQPATNPPSTVLSNSLPLTFENTLEYKFVDFGGNTMSVVANPKKSGINTSNKVGKIVKSVGSEIWAGSFIDLDKPFDFSTNKIFKVKVYSPKSGAKIRLKVEHLTNRGMYLEKDANTTKVNEWEELTFNFNTYTGGTYQKVVLFFDFEVVGDGTANSTFYFDDITLTN